jgi:hypothetical protein
VNSTTYARKSMIRCGLSLDLNGVWCVNQLFPELQRIVKEYPSHFDGTYCNDEDPGESEDTDAGKHSSSSNDDDDQVV